MATYFYKAYDSAGHKRAGTLRVPTLPLARARLRERGLQTYFLEDLKVVRAETKRRRRRHQIILACGGVLIAGALVLSGLIVGYAARERPTDVAQYQKAGVLDGAAGMVVAKGPDERAFAREMYEAWNSFAPGVMNGIEVTKHLMTIYVSPKIKDMDRRTLETLATNSTRALQRRFNGVGVTLLIVQDNSTVMEISYNSYTRSTKVKSYF